MPTVASAAAQLSCRCRGDRATGRNERLGSSRRRVYIGIILTVKMMAAYTAPRLHGEILWELVPRSLCIPQSQLQLTAALQGPADTRLQKSARRVLLQRAATRRRRGRPTSPATWPGLRATRRTTGHVRPQWRVTSGCTSAEYYPAEKSRWESGLSGARPSDGKLKAWTLLVLCA